MQTKQDFIRSIEQSLGDQCSRNFAEAVYDYLWTADMISQHRQNIVTVNDGVDYDAAAKLIWKMMTND
jgi:hypothetical protein